MKYKLTLALVASLTSTALAAFQAPLPEFKNEKQLAEWRAEKASEAASLGNETPETFFFTGKPYIATVGNYAFKYRSYSSSLARWTSEDPSGFPDGANGISYITNDPVRWVDDTGLSGQLVIYSNSDGGSSSFNTSGHSWISYTPDVGTTLTYGTWGNNPTGSGNGLFTNLELGSSGKTSRSNYLNNAAEARLLAEIASYAAMGANGWQIGNPCCSFASSAWSKATGEYLSPGLPSTPTGLANSLVKPNGEKSHGIFE